MRRIASTLLVATGLSIGFVQVSFATDLPRRPTYTAPILAPASVYSWTGFYVGGSLGGAFGNVEATDVNTGTTTSPNSSGFAGGGQIGFDYQTGPWVIGIRNIFVGTDLSKSASSGSGTADSHVNWFDALTVRGGYLLQPNLLLYVQGGAAWTQWDVTFLNTAGTQIGEIGNNSRTGWTVGGGVEWMFVPHWSAFLEYNYMGFGTRSATFTACGGACANVSAKADPTRMSWLA